MNALLPLLSFLGGALLVWLVMRASSKVAQERLQTCQTELETTKVHAAELRVRAEQTAAKDAEIAARDAALEGLRAELGSLQSKLAASESAAQEKEASLREQIGLIEQAEKKLTEAFQNLATEAVRKSQDDFLKLATEQFRGQKQESVGELEKRKQAIEEMLKPMTTKLGELDQATRAMEKEREKAYGELRTELRSINDLGERLRKETGQLVTALRNPVRRGQWGEIQLRRVVEMAGMLDKCDFVSQAHVVREEGRLRPDIVVNLPNGRTIVVDAKAPLDAFTHAAECEDDDERRRHYEQHARQVKNHVVQLSGKAYWSSLDCTPEFVVMFLPGEPIFSTAVERDPELLEFGVSNGVLIATPMTLIALLKSVAAGWRQEQQQENAKRIAAVGRDLYNSLAVFAKHYQGVGKSLAQALSSYNSSVGSLERNVLSKGRRLKDYGGLTDEDLPEVEAREAVVRQVSADELNTLLVPDESLLSLEPGHD